MYYDLLTRIKNAARAGKQTIVAPFSKFDFAIAKVLAAEGYLASADKKVIGKKNFLELVLNYKDDSPAFSDFRLLSKPSRHLYSGYRDLKPVRQQYGVAVISTPKGVMTNRAARKEKVGGEYLFEIW